MASSRNLVSTIGVHACPKKEGRNVFYPLSHVMWPVLCIPVVCLLRPVNNNQRKCILGLKIIYGIVIKNTIIEKEFIHKTVWANMLTYWLTSLPTQYQTYSFWLIVDTSAQWYHWDVLVHFMAFTDKTQTLFQSKPSNKETSLLEQWKQLITISTRLQKNALRFFSFSQSPLVEWWCPNTPIIRHLHFKISSISQVLHSSFCFHF